YNYLSFFFSSRRRHTRSKRDWSSDVCSSDLNISKGEAIVTTDVGQHQMWVAQFYKFDWPYRWVTSGGLGTIGFGFPAAIGAQLGDRKSVVVAIVGDGGFQMTAHELSVVYEKQLPVKVII